MVILLGVNPSTNGSCGHDYPDVLPTATTEVLLTSPIVRLWYQLKQREGLRQSFLFVC